MKETREKKAAYLFDELGGIDDRLLTEAMRYRKKKTTPVPIKWAGIAVAAVLCFVLIAGGTVGITKWIGGAEVPRRTEESPALTLDGVLEDAYRNRSSAVSYTVITEKEVSDMLREARLIWQVREGDEYCVSRLLTEREVNDLLLGLRSGGACLNGRESDTFCKVWLSIEDGVVLTPYLSLTEGNIGIETLFDYNAEILPSQQVFDLISTIIGSR